MTDMKLSEDMQERLLCPITRERLFAKEECLSTPGGIRYPIVRGVPVVINEANSVFDIDDLAFRNVDSHGAGADLLLSWIPSISLNVKSRQNCEEMIEMLPKTAKILVVGGSIKGAGMDPIYSNRAFDVVGLDIVFGPFTSIIADAHDLPFEEETFDCVIIQAVLEYLVDPHRCVAEIYRTLKRDAIVYAETPFMQQVHGGKLDFTRYTHLGLLSLFRNFEEIKSGPCCGPGMALASAWAGFCRSFATSRASRLVARLFSRYTAFLFKYFDYYLIDKPGSFDAASGTFFLGRKSEKTVSDRELIKKYRGLSGK